MTRWGIAGTGGIAHAMADTLAAIEGAELSAVSSSDSGRGDAFAAEYAIPTMLTPHSAIAESGVDVVYAATTNEKHREVTLACLDAGIAVLCEKPLATTHADARAMIDRAHVRGVFLMEAMWMVFQPAFTQLQRLVDEGVIGKPQHVSADFGFPADPARSPRLFDPALGGGGLLDLGVYPLTLATEVLGPPRQVAAVGVPTSSGVDAQVGIAVHHVGGGISTLSSSLLADTSTAAVISGTDGRIYMHPPFHHSPRVSLHRRGDIVQEWDTSYAGSGYRFEVEEVHACLAEGRTQSEIRPLSKTLEVMKWLEEIARQINIPPPASEASIGRGDPQEPEG